jgi:hypothetical protein
MFLMRTACAVSPVNAVRPRPDQQEGFRLGMGEIGRREAVLLPRRRNHAPARRKRSDDVAASNLCVIGARWGLNGATNAEAEQDDGLDHEPHGRNGRVAQRPNIGYPKLFIGGAVGRREAPAAPAVNNFVAANPAPGLGWPMRFICGYPLPWFSRPGGPGLLTTSRVNDSELMDRPVGRDLTL